MLRKPLVSDILRSVVYCTRTGDRTMLFPILGFQVPSLLTPKLLPHQAVLTEFIAWAFSVQPDERVVVRNATMLRAWCRALSPEEHAYLIHLLQTHYVRTR